MIKETEVNNKQEFNIIFGIKSSILVYYYTAIMLVLPPVLYRLRKGKVVLEI
uniref:Uncharacterized protein n=1 Tax=Rhizophagus irregularis (strain DAOM 181602 / DAOM 197198 / MUCL 43194) TaxID=747089 RepID=U9T1K7_RHIID